MSKFKLSKLKLNSLFNNIYKYDGARTLLAKRLNIHTSTLEEYLSLGKKYLEEYEDILEEALDIEEKTDYIDEEFEDSREDMKCSYMEKEGINALGDKYRNAFEVFFYEEREKAREKCIYDIQKEFIESQNFVKDVDKNRQIQILILFKLIYDRGQLSLDEEKLYLKSRYTKTSSKHVNAIIKDLERRNKEDFSDDKKDDSSSRNTTGNITNIFSFVLEADKQKRELLEDKSVINIDSDDYKIIE